jgi:hypothetical protein
MIRTFGPRHAIKQLLRNRRLPHSTPESKDRLFDSLREAVFRMHRGDIPTPQLQQSRSMSKSASSSLGSRSVRQNHGTRGVFHTSSKMPSQQKQDPEKRTSRPQASQRQFHDVLPEHSSKTNETLRTMLERPLGKLPRRYARPDKQSTAPQLPARIPLHQFIQLDEHSNILLQIPCFTTTRGHRKACYIPRRALKASVPSFEERITSEGVYVHCTLSWMFLWKKDSSSQR